MAKAKTKTTAETLKEAEAAGELGGATILVPGQAMLLHGLAGGSLENVEGVITIKDVAGVVWAVLNIGDSGNTSTPDPVAPPDPAPDAVPDPVPDPE